MKTKKPLSIITLVLLATLTASPLLALDEDKAAPAPQTQIDTEMAAKINPITSMLDHKGLVEHSCKVSAADALKMLNEGKEKVTLLDVRTPAEAGVIGLTLPHALQIPMDQLFKPENLERLPKEGTILVICHSGNRAAGSTALLAAVGFRNVRYVNGGLISLVTELTPKALPYK